MKKVFIFLSTLVVLALNSGCSATWEGVKEDSSDMVDATREAIHDVTR